MELVKSVLQEELEYAVRLKSRYEELLAECPKGSLIRRKIKRADYFYLSYRESPLKVKQKYLGRLSKDEVRDYKEKIGKRKKLEKSLKEVKQKILYLRKTLHVKAR
ncbi:MAG: hypothetical protein V2A78_10040 [bacterium]